MSFLLDSTVLVDTIRDRAVTKRWVARQPLDQLYVSTVTIGELFRGLHQKYVAKPDELALALEELRMETLQPFDGHILPFDQASAEIWGRLMGEGAAIGLSPPTDDAKIAAMALRHRMTVATSNPRHFERYVSYVDPRIA